MTSTKTDPEVAFNGSKLAILYRGRILSLLRDDIPTIPYPGLWDLPGGGREGAETPEACALRETMEEAALRIDPAAIVWRRFYLSDGAITWFLVAKVDHIAGVRLGDEGQALRWFDVAHFLLLPGAIDHMQARLETYLAESGSSSL